MITAKVIADSISPDGIRLTTMQLRYPRMVHADFMAHKAFSRNGRSSRAVPFATLVKEEPYMPEFCYNQKGMTAGEPLTGDDLEQANYLWKSAAIFCQNTAEHLSKIGGKGVHKQWVNRMLEWFGYIDVLVSSTDWANFFALRDEAGAQPEIQELARAMKVAMAESTPVYTPVGMWHMPYIGRYDFDLIASHIGLDQFPCATFRPELRDEAIDLLKKISVARCARLTIKPFDGNSTIEAELKRYDLLMVSRPVHASPAEHIATPDNKASTLGGILYAKDGTQVFPELWDNSSEHANYYGWRQFRKQIPFNTVYDR